MEVRVQGVRGVLKSQGRGFWACVTRSDAAESRRGSRGGAVAGAGKTELACRHAASVRERASARAGLSREGALTCGVAASVKGGRRVGWDAARLEERRSGSW